MNKNILLPARFLRRNTFILWCINIRSNKKLFASLQNSYVNQYISKPIPVQVYAKTVWWDSSKSRQKLSSCLPSVSRAKWLKNDILLTDGRNMVWKSDTCIVDCIQQQSQCSNANSIFVLYVCLCYANKVFFGHLKVTLHFFTFIVLLMSIN